MNIEAYIQARMGSTRLPGKVLKRVCGRPLLDILIERLGQAQEIDGIAVLTSTLPGDDPIEQFCQEHKIPCFRGSEDDVLSRYAQAAQQWNPDAIVRITADCPLIDPDILDEVVRVYRDNASSVDYVSNTLEKTYPLGLDVEVFSCRALEQADRMATRPDEREHVTLYMYRHPELFRLRNVAHKPSLAHCRWTVDTPEDFALVSRILDHLLIQHPRFRMSDILHLLDQHPDWRQLNAHVQQKIPLK